MNLDQEQFAINIAANAKNHDEWLSVVKYGLRTLMAAPVDLLAQIIAQEAAREAERLRSEPHHEIGRIMRELGLGFVG